MTEIARVTVNLGQLRKENLRLPERPFHSALQQLLGGGPEKSDRLRETLQNSDQCTIVYHACGSCPNGGAKTEYFCSSNGGSEPDYYFCDDC